MILASDSVCQIAFCLSSMNSALSHMLDSHVTVKVPSLNWLLSRAAFAVSRSSLARKFFH